MSDYKYLFKFIIIGESGTGKSSLLLRFIDGKFSPLHDITIGVEFASKILFINENKHENIDNYSNANTSAHTKSNSVPVKIQIWDTAGQESFRSITRSYYRATSGALLVYDVTKRHTFENLKKWVEEIKQYSNQDVVITLVGNKSDLENRRVISTKEGKTFAEKHGFSFIETSAKTGDNVNNAFIQTAENIYSTIPYNAYEDETRGIKRGNKVVLSFENNESNNTINTGNSSEDKYNYMNKVRQSCCY